MIIEYEIVRRDLVTAYLKDGWHLHGSPFMQELLVDNPEYIEDVLQRSCEAHATEKLIINLAHQAMVMDDDD